MTPEQLAAIRERVEKAATKGCGDFYCLRCSCGDSLCVDGRALLAYVEELEIKAMARRAEVLRELGTWNIHSILTLIRVASKNPPAP